MHLPFRRSLGGFWKYFRWVPANSFASKIREPWLCSLLCFFLPFCCCCLIFIFLSPIREDHLFSKTLSLKLSAVVTPARSRIVSGAGLCAPNLLLRISHQVLEVTSVGADNSLHISSSSRWDARDQGWPRCHFAALVFAQVPLNTSALAASTPLRLQGAFALSLSGFNIF